MIVKNMEDIHIFWFLFGVLLIISGMVYVVWNHAMCIIRGIRAFFMCCQGRCPNPMARFRLIMENSEVTMFTTEMAHKTIRDVQPSLSRKEICLQQFLNITFNDDIKYCGATFDGYLCWPPTAAGELTSQKCPPARLSDTNNDAFRVCGSEGLWLDRKHNESSVTGWTNYTLCFPMDVRSLLTKVYDNEQDAQEKFNVAERTRSMEHVGFSISLIALVISLFLFTYFRSLRNSRTRIHKSLFTAMTVQVIIRLTLYIDQAITRSRIADGTSDSHWSIENMPYVCEASYVLLEYAITVMFMWMFIEGLYLHNVVTGNSLREQRSHKIYYLVGWGLPVVLTGLWAAMTHLHYKSEHAITCWYGYNFTALYWILQGPRLACILINLVFLLNIMRVLIMKLRRSESNEIDKVRKAVRAALVLLPLLGITNILNMIEPPLNPVWSFALWSYTTHFLRCFQGFFIAVIYCFLNGEVRTVVQKQYDNYMAMRATARPRRTEQNSPRCCCRCARAWRSTEDIPDIELGQYTRQQYPQQEHYATSTVDLEAQNRTYRAIHGIPILPTSSLYDVMVQRGIRESIAEDPQY